MIDPQKLADIAARIATPATDEQLSSVSALARKQQRLEALVADTEKRLGEIKDELAQVSETLLPDAMAAVGLSEFKLEDGYRVTVALEYYANIPSPDSDSPELQDRRAQAFQWMRDNNHGPLLKNQIIVDAGRGEEEKAGRVMRGLEAAGIPFKRVENIHWSTLRAFVKEQMTPSETQRAPFPSHLFGAHSKRVASIKASKKKG